MTVQKIKSGRIPGLEADNFVGDNGQLFFNEGVGDLRLGDGVTPGGIPLSVGGGGGGYILPTASTTVKGGVKVDGTTITIASQIISVGSITYDKISNPPTIPSNTNQLTNGAGFITSSALTGYATETYVTTRGYLTSVSWNDVQSKPSFATVATTGSYTDLANRPTLFSGSYNDLTNKPTLFSGSYTDLTNKPTIPTDISDLTDTEGLLGQGGGGGTTYITNNVENPYAFSVAADDSTLREISNGETLRFQGATGITVTSDLEGKITITGPDLSSYATQSYVTSQGYITSSALLGYATESYVTTRGYLTSVSWNELTDKPNLAGTYSWSIAADDSTQIPVNADNTIKFLGGVGIDTTADANGNITITGFSGSYTDLTDRPSLFSGSYNDLTDKPNLAGTYSWSIAADDSTQIEISSGNLVKIVGSRGVTTTSNADGQITITGPDLSSYATQTYVNTALANAGVTVASTAPTGLSNGALWYNTATSVLSVLYDTQWISVNFSGNYNDLTNKPTNVSSFTNDAQYTTRDEVYAMILELAG
jgi:hypothetical protein